MQYTYIHYIYYIYIYIIFIYLYNIYIYMYVYYVYPSDSSIKMFFMRIIGAKSYLRMCRLHCLSVPSKGLLV